MNSKKIEGPASQTLEQPVASDLTHKGIPYLIALKGSNAGWRYAISDDLTIGRDPSCDIQVPAVDVSRLHAKITKVGDRELWLEDLQSQNGTQVNGKQIKKQMISIGDTLQFGAESQYFYTLYSSLEEQLLEEQTLESVARLAGGIAHDFNNLMAAVLIDVDFLRHAYQHSGGADPDFVAGLENIEAAAKKTASLTSQLLSFARRGKYEDRVINFSSLVEDVALLLRDTLDPLIVVQAQVEPNLLVNGDPEQLHQVLLNLCFNARDAMPDGGSLVLKGTKLNVGVAEPSGSKVPPPGNYVQLEVRDTGKGIEPAIRKKIFEPFFTTKDVGQGTGLGLATVYGVVKNHNGQVEVESEFGQGSVFKVYLPLSEMLLQETSSLPTESMLAVVGRTILIIEDESSQRRTLSKLLQAIGFSVLEAGDGMEAVKLFHEHHTEVKLILLDMILPHLSGKETFRWLKKIDPQVPVVLTSGYLDDQRIQEMMAEGANGFLCKPYDLEELEKTVNGAIE
jgi:signal transduction histidine kinase/CheY-like chemotaxis protein